MELAFMFVFLFLWIATTVFLSFWIKNLITKLKRVAEDRQEKLQILHEFVDRLEEIDQHEMLSGYQLFRDHKS